MLVYVSSEHVDSDQSLVFIVFQSPPHQLFLTLPVRLSLPPGFDVVGCIHQYQNGKAATVLDDRSESCLAVVPLYGQKSDSPTSLSKPLATSRYAPLVEPAVARACRHHARGPVGDDGPILQRPAFDIVCKG